MVRACFLLLAVCLAGGCNKGVALDITVEPNCVTEGQLVDHVTFKVALTLAGGKVESRTYSYAAASFFASDGTSNRLVIILPDGSKHADVVVEALDSHDGYVGQGEQSFNISGPNIYDATLDLGNASCPAPGDSPDGGSGGGGDMTSGGGGRDGGAIVAVNGSGAASPGGVTSLSLMPPDTAQPGDVIIGIIDFNLTTATITTPTGWTLIGSATCDTNRTYQGNFYWHLITSGETTPYVFTFSGNSLINGALAAYRGVDTTAPVAAHQTLGDNTGFALPSVNVPAAGALAVVIVDYPGTQTGTIWTAPTGMTTLFSNDVSAIFDATVQGPSTFAPAMLNSTASASCAVTATIILQ